MEVENIFKKVFQEDFKEEKITFEMFDEYCKKEYNEKKPIYRIIVY